LKTSLSKVDRLAFSFGGASEEPPRAHGRGGVYFLIMTEESYRAMWLTSREFYDIF
jgi:hypothetical protein